MTDSANSGSPSQVQPIDTATLDRLAQIFEQEGTLTVHKKSQTDPRSLNGRVREERTSHINKWRDNDQTNHGLRAVSGGKAIDCDLAIQLRLLVLGKTVYPYSKDWNNMSLHFQSQTSAFRFGLHAKRNGTRGVIMCLQAQIIKNLAFKEGNPKIIFEPTDSERQKALVQSICDILWRAGQARQCCLCLPDEQDQFQTAGANYRFDGLTEKLRLFYFEKYEDLEKKIKQYREYYERETTSGCLLFVYSVVLSRGVDRILEDMGVMRIEECSLLGDLEQCTPVLANLILTGKATRYLHNGDIIYDDKEQPLTKPLLGVKGRGDIGFLYWSKDEDYDHRTQVGSMLKTPKFPIWLSLINGYYGLLFSTNQELMNDWRKEHAFTLYYYTGLPTQTQQCSLSINTRVWKEPIKVKNGREPEKTRPALEECILTKWHGAEINWNGNIPFV